MVIPPVFKPIGDAVDNHILVLAASWQVTSFNEVNTVHVSLYSVWSTGLYESKPASGEGTSAGLHVRKRESRRILGHFPSAMCP